MGRPPLGERPMTKAELQARWRRGLKPKRLEERIAKLEAELKELRKALREHRRREARKKTAAIDCG
jgi:hypothetical protein